MNNMMLSCLENGAGEVDGYFTGGSFHSYRRSHEVDVLDHRYNDGLGVDRGAGVDHGFTHVPNYGYHRQAPSTGR